MNDFPACSLALFACLLVSAELPAIEAAAQRPELIQGSRRAEIENAQQRAKLPLYKTIPAAKNSELTPAAVSAATSNFGASWSRSNGDSANTRYSALTQINSRNVGDLEVAWTYRSHDGAGYIQANPVIVNGVMYAPTAGKNIVAINGETGEEIWRFRPPLQATLAHFYDPKQKVMKQFQADDPNARGLIALGFGPAQRGLTYWAGNSENEPRLFFMANGYLIALNVKTGKAIETFGSDGQISSSKGPGRSSFLGMVPPAIFKNVIVAPNQNAVDAFDVRTGKHLWTFNTLLYPVSNAEEDNGGNVWGGVAMDDERGIAVIATGDPHPNFVGIDRPGSNKHTSSVVALDALTGRMLWSFQEIAHNLWDLDISAPPNLVTISHDGKRVDAVAQVTKLGNTLLLDRLTGKPLFPFRLRRAPVSTVPGERTEPYQPAVELPQPFARQVFTLDDVTNISPESRASVLEKVNQGAFGWFEPPRVDKPTIFYGVHGGAEWSGASFDPSTGWLYVSANELPWVESLSRSVSPTQRASHEEPSAGESLYQQNCAVCHGESRQGKGMAPSLQGIGARLSASQIVEITKSGRNAMPPIPMAEDDRKKLVSFVLDQDNFSLDPGREPNASSSVTYTASSFARLVDNQGYPGSKPPWGTLNAIDLNTGKLVFKVPLGEHEELTQRGIPKTGTENFGGPMVTAGGLVFCAGTRDLKIRAFDKSNGEELWQSKLPYGGFAPPASYEVKGRQYVVIAATGGGKLGGERGDVYIAFALPRKQ